MFDARSGVNAPYPRKTVCSALCNRNLLRAWPSVEAPVAGDLPGLQVVVRRLQKEVVQRWSVAISGLGQQHLL